MTILKNSLFLWFGENDMYGFKIKLGYEWKMEDYVLLRFSIYKYRKGSAHIKLNVLDHYLFGSNQKVGPR
jgi:hypothetical protein